MKVLHGGSSLMAVWTLCEPLMVDEFGTMNRAVSRKGQEINANWMSRLTRYESSGAVYYVKTYVCRGRGLRRWFGRSRLRAEWENLQLFARYGIATAEVIAYGETGLRNYQGAIITRGLLQTRDLARLAEEGNPILLDKRWRLGVIRRLSELVRIMHTRGFIHNDLKWRNILVGLDIKSNKNPPRVYLIDCPMGRFLCGPLMRRGIVKDLACLDKVAKYALSRTDRLRFYLAYSGKTQLQRNDKVLIKKVLRFFAGRE